MERCSILKVFLIQSWMIWFALAASNFTDQLALLAFKSEIRSSPNNILVHNWSTATSFCNWVGISCSTHRHRITALKLSDMGLQGTISPQISNLSFLALLDLGNNSFHGSLAYELGHLRRLKVLILQFNQLEGVIPPSLHYCQRLRVISLAYNGFSSGIPKELGMLPKLRTLFLGRNNLLGSIPSSLGNISTLEYFAANDAGLAGSIPSTIFNITSLLSLVLTNNSFSGILPMDLCHNCPKLQDIDLSYNHLRGHVLSTIYQCKDLRMLDGRNNRFEGSILTEIGNLSKLETLVVGDNNITGTIPTSLGNISTLQTLHFGSSQIHGKIPGELGHLPNLLYLVLYNNHLTGAIPQAIFNISSLQYLSLTFNTLSGILPATAGLWLPNLEELYLDTNQIGGNIPLHLSNSSKLTQLHLGINLFSGPVPENLGNLQLLKFLNLEGNQLTTEHGSRELSFLTTLTNNCCLERLFVSDNPLDGFLPSSIGNHSSPLQMFSAFGCQLIGHIPAGLGSFRNLTLLELSSNSLNGTIPSTIGGMKSLQRLFLDDNNIEGLIPNELCHLHELGELLLQNNNLSGSIPSCIGDIRHLQKLFLDSNKLNSSIPASFWDLEDLIFLNLSSNSLGGYLPMDIGKLQVLEYIDLSWNQISGNISSTIGALQSLVSLNFSRNSFQGPIPQTFGSLVAMEFTDLSYNNLSGTIPKSLEELSHLRYLNLSFNKLSGEIPSVGPFANFTAQSFLENEALCGKPVLQVPPCSRSTSKSKTRQILLRYVIPATVFVTIIVAFFYMLRKYREKSAQMPITTNLSPALGHRMISHHELRRATNNFSETNLLGVGSFGSVYKGILSDGSIIAVKVLNLQLEGAFKSFDAECKVLRGVRHRNLIKVISSCSNPEFKALVLQYMSNGSLEKWLHSQSYCLDLPQRASIMVDVALALEYLHDCQPEPVVHCDLKPSNILLDEDMVAHVGDFGIAKILAENKTGMQTKTLGTLGYIAPEYGSEGKVSTKGDIYSYGITLLETLTARKPTDQMFTEELNLRQWVSASLPNNIMEVVDSSLLRMEGGTDMIAAQGNLLAIMELGLECTKEMPEERSNIKDVLVKLDKIKAQLVHSGYN